MSLRFDKDKEEEQIFYYKLQDLRSMSTMERQRFKRNIVKKLHLSDEDELRLDFNLSSLRDVLTSDPNILKVTAIDENIPRDSEDRKRYLAPKAVSLPLITKTVAGKLSTPAFNRIV